MVRNVAETDLIPEYVWKLICEGSNNISNKSKQPFNVTCVKEIQWALKQETQKSNKHELIQTCSTQTLKAPEHLSEEGR